jgi:hypothetical protein
MRGQVGSSSDVLHPLGAHSFGLKTNLAWGKHVFVGEWLEDPAVEKDNSLPE